MKLRKAMYKAGLIALVAVATLYAPTAFAEHGEDEELEAAAIASASISLSDAIAAAKGSGKGTPFEAGLEEEDDKWIYEVKVADKDGKVSRVFLDPGSGKIIDTSAEGLMERAYKMVFDRDDRQRLDIVRTAKVDLGRAVALAEQASGGRAFDAGVHNEDGKMVYEVELNINGDSENVNVDPQTGQVVKLADDEKGEHGEHSEHEEHGEHKEENEHHG